MGFAAIWEPQGRESRHEACDQGFTKRFIHTYRLFQIAIEAPVAIARDFEKAVEILFTHTEQVLCRTLIQLAPEPRFDAGE